VKILKKWNSEAIKVLLFQVFGHYYLGCSLNSHKLSSWCHSGCDVLHPLLWRLLHPITNQGDLRRGTLVHSQTAKVRKEGHFQGTEISLKHLNRFIKMERSTKGLYSEKLKRQLSTGDSAYLWKKRRRKINLNLNPPHSFDNSCLGNDSN